MDKQIEILLGSQKNINSTVVDTNERIGLFNCVSKLTEYNINEEINATDLFNSEREENEIYRIYGRLEWMSLLNGLSNDYKYFKDFFNTKYDNTTKNILSSFRFYLVKPADSDYRKFNKFFYSEGELPEYERKFQVVATPSDFEIYPVGFSKNLFNEQLFGFSFKKDFDVSNIYDDLMFPITELFLYAEYIATENGNGVDELLKFTEWDNTGNDSISTMIPTQLNVGDFVKNNIGNNICDVILYDKENFIQSGYTGQTFYITTQCKLEDNSSIDLIWKYNPFIPIKLRYLGNELYDANTGSTTYDIVTSIPEYATKIDDAGNYVWREVLPEGYIDPLTGIGVDHPFLNGRRYVFSTLLLSIVPDLSDDETRNAFNSIWFTQNARIKNIKPNDDLDNIGKPCM